MSEEIIVLQPSREKDPDGSMLRGVLTAHFALEVAQARRVVLTCLLVVVSAIDAIVVAWPPRSPLLRTLAVFGWIVCALGLLAAIRAERHWRRARTKLSTALGTSAAR
jgi:peptidoglycan/LPS O-acetylase OafA/YrhL